MQLLPRNNKAPLKEKSVFDFYYSFLSFFSGNPAEETLPLNELRDPNENDANGAPSHNRSPGLFVVVNPWSIFIGNAQCRQCRLRTPEILLNFPKPAVKLLRLEVFGLERQ